MSLFIIIIIMISPAKSLQTEDIEVKFGRVASVVASDL